MITNEPERNAANLPVYQGPIWSGMKVVLRGDDRPVTVAGLAIAPDHTAFTLRERRGVYTRAHIDPYETETLEHPEPEPWNNYVSTVRTRG